MTFDWMFQPMTWCHFMAYIAAWEFGKWLAGIIIRMVWER